MTTKDDFTEDEWARIVRAPMVAGMAISLADPGGPIEAAKESMATVRSATNPPSREQLLAEVALEIQADCSSATIPQGLQAHRCRNQRRASRCSTNSCCARDRLLQGTAEETAAFGTWLVTTAQAAADAAKEGGFMGFQAERVSEREQAMLDQVRGAVTG